MTIPRDAKWVTRQQVAEIFQVSLLTVKRWGEDGTLPAYRIGGSSVRYKRVDVETLAKPIEHAEHDPEGQ